MFKNGDRNIFQLSPFLDILSPQDLFCKELRALFLQKRNNKRAVVSPFLASFVYDKIITP